MTELDHRQGKAAIDAIDDRVLTLKVLDRLHNMRSLHLPNHADAFSRADVAREVDWDVER